MLGNDQREQRLLERVGLALKRAEAVLEDVEILRRERDVSLLGKPHGVLVIGRVLDLRVGNIARTPLEPVLANHHGPLFTFLDILGQEQDAVRKNVGEDVHHHFVAGEERLVEDLSRADVRRQQRQVESPDDLVRKILAVRLDRLVERVERRDVELLHELAANVGAFDQKLLVVAVELVKLALLASLRALASVDRRPDP